MSNLEGITVCFICALFVASLYVVQIVVQFFSGYPPG